PWASAGAVVGSLTTLGVSGRPALEPAFRMTVRAAAVTMTTMAAAAPARSVPETRTWPRGGWTWRHPAAWSVTVGASRVSSGSSGVELLWVSTSAHRPGGGDL